MDERGRRKGLNEAVYREVNERLREMNEAFSQLTDRMDLICDCADGDCHERLSMTPTAYEALRSDPVLFVIVPGHESPSVEHVVELRDDYVVVRKWPGEPAELARATGAERSSAASDGGA